MKGAPDKQEPPRHDQPRPRGGFRDVPGVARWAVASHAAALTKRGGAIDRVMRAVQHRREQAVLRRGLSVEAAFLDQFMRAGVLRPGERMGEAFRVERDHHFFPVTRKWGEPFEPVPAMPPISRPRPKLRELRRMVEANMPSYKLGLVHLGEGHYSDVYELGKRRVLKIVKRGDRGYAKFVGQCLEHRDNPHLPKIYWRGKWGDKDVYILERLVDHSYYADRQNLQQAIKLATNNPYLTVSCPKVAQLKDLIGRDANDLRIDNILAREDGTPVVTDPYHMGRDHDFA